MTLPQVAVVGADGFLGRHVRDALVTAGHRVLSLTRSGPDDDDPERRRLPDDPSALRSLLVEESIGATVNCAGATHGTKRELEVANVALVEMLLAALARTGIRLVQLGSAAEYGPGEPGRPTREDDPVRPVSEYGISKLAATRLMGAAAQREEVDGLTLRVFNPVGAGISVDQLPGRAALAIREARTTGSDVHLGPLGATRDFVDARDVADAAVAACGASALSGRILNIGSGRPVTAREMVGLLAAVAAYGGAIVEDEATSSHSAPTDWQVADIGAAVEALGWAPRRSLRDAVTALWEAG